MRPYIKPFIIVILSGLLSVGFAQEAPTLPKEPAPTLNTNAVSIPSFPYIAEITGNDIYIRSGAGTNYYTCGKLNKGDTVMVVEIQYNWSRIVPPDGCFSLISTQYVVVDPNNPTAGIVNGDNVRVYAGSDSVKPLYSTTLQLKLNRSDKVKLLGEEKDNYYKIVPPAGAYVWVSTQYTKAIGSAGEVPLTIPTKTEAKVDTGTVAPTTAASIEAEKLKEYYALEKKIQAERAKPVNEQNYADIKRALAEIANNKQAGKAIRFAEFVIKQIERYELALAVAKEVKLQNEQLKQIQQGIEKARATRLSEYQEMGKFAAVGELATFETYGPGHYRVVDESGKTICYALPSESVSQVDFSRSVGQKVGLIGTVEPHSHTEVALVRFTEIVQLK